MLDVAHAEALLDGARRRMHGLLAASSNPMALLEGLVPLPLAQSRLLFDRRHEPPAP